MDTSEFVRPLYSSPNTGPIAPSRARRPVPRAGPLADTDLPLPQDQPGQLPRRQRAASTGTQPRIDGPDRFAGRAVSVPRRAAGRAGAVERESARGPGLAADFYEDVDPRSQGSMADDGGSRGSRLLDRPRVRRPAPRKSPKAKPDRPRKSSAAGGRKGRVQAGFTKAKTRAKRRVSRKLLVIGAAAVVAVVGVAAIVLFWPKPSHVITTPAAVGSFALQQENPTAEALKKQIVTAAPGDVKNVVAAVYKHSIGTGAAAQAQIVVFIGGNLTGTASASSLISAYMADMSGSFTTSPGKLGGRAACAPGSNGGPAECAWADNDTFGVLVSATLTANALADEMRLMRPLVEHVKK
jgi:hypothetical protein